ncbi:uncharacterized protein I303_106278 [Kwoniella dejecticola CBS 10117]|uniref:AAA+ ATPase domain-containing protein n=1 Tax=Kwoniella dejecticola CBS 10117 TaxID=1296121 RepID=A0AAJ8KTM9_9TREE
MGIIIFFYRLLATLLGGFQKSPMFHDGIRVALAGMFFEFSRRFAHGLIGKLIDSIYLTAVISSNDEAYDWIQHYMNIQCPIVIDSLDTSNEKTMTQAENDEMYSLKTNLKEIFWPRGKAAPRHIIISSGFGSHRPGIPVPPWIDPRNAYGSCDSLDDGEAEEEREARLDIEPAIAEAFDLGITRYLKHKGRSIRIVIGEDETRVSMNNVQKKWLVMSTFLGTHDTFTSLIQEARRQYMIQIPKRTISIFSPEPGNRWYRSASRPMRSWDSIILPPGVKEWLLTDTTEFLAERDYYEQRGVPHRRGYLLYGEPGSGKSSLISALAAKLKLDIYIINLGSRMMDDDTLNSLLQSCPSRCLLLMEDIDCAFKKRQSITHDEDKSQSGDDQSNEGDQDAMMSIKPKMLYRGRRMQHPGMGMGEPGSSVTLSGLLNALDGVASSEGRLLFCTTNWKDKIDPALSRNGRCDVWIEFTHATRAQAKDLFTHFYKNDNNPYPNSNSACSPSPLHNTGMAEERDLTAYDPSHLVSLADAFAEAIPLHKVSVSALQGYLIRHKRKPAEAAEGVKAWVDSGFGQGPTMFLKDGKMELKEIETSPTPSTSQTLNMPNGHMDTNTDDYGVDTQKAGMQLRSRKRASSKMDQIKGISVNGRGIENIPNGSIASGNDGLLRRAKTHFRALSKGKNGDDVQ